jgi:hypothetical protein
VCVASAQGVFDEWPHWLGHDANVTSRCRCVVTAHSKAVEGSWRGVGKTSQFGSARARGGPWHPKAAARHGGEVRRRWLRGAEAAQRAPAGMGTKEDRVLGLVYRRFIGGARHLASSRG